MEAMGVTNDQQTTITTFSNRLSDRFSIHCKRAKEKVGWLVRCGDEGLQVFEKYIDPGLDGAIKTLRQSLTITTILMPTQVELLNPAASGLQVIAAVSLVLSARRVPQELRDIHKAAQEGDKKELGLKVSLFLKNRLGDAGSVCEIWNAVGGLFSIATPLILGTIAMATALPLFAWETIDSGYKLYASGKELYLVAFQWEDYQSQWLTATAEEKTLLATKLTTLERFVSPKAAAYLENLTQQLQKLEAEQLKELEQFQKEDSLPILQPLSGEMAERQALEQQLIATARKDMRTLLLVTAVDHAASFATNVSSLAIITTALATPMAGTTALAMPITFLGGYAVKMAINTTSALVLSRSIENQSWLQKPKKQREAPAPLGATHPMAATE